MEKKELTEEQKAKLANPEKQEFFHESGMQYYPIKMVSQEDEADVITLRLFETMSNERLEFETPEEFRIRRAYTNKAQKDINRGQMVWNPQWGPMNMENAQRVKEYLDKGEQVPVTFKTKKTSFKERLKNAQLNKNKR